MSDEPIVAWDAKVLAASEGTFGTTPNPAASQAYEFVDVNLGNAELGAVRPKKDRNVGRGMSDGFIVGRVGPMPWSLNTTVKTRAAIDTVPNESVLYKAGGLVQTVNTSTSVVYSLSSSPREDGSMASASLYHLRGTGTGSSSSRYLAEQMRGCITKSIEWSGGDKELFAKFSGDGIGKYHLGYASSVSLADNSTTSLDLGSTESAYRFGLGWYQIESEIVQITAINYATHIATIVRGALSSSAASHAAKPIVPYLPTGISYAGSPIPETSVTVTVDGQTIRFQNFSLTLTTGIEQGPGETGSAHIQTYIVKRYSVKMSLKGLMRREDVALLGKVEQQANPLAVTIACGTGVGGIVTFSLPYCELDAFGVPDNANDVAYQTVPLRTRDSATGNDLMTITYT